MKNKKYINNQIGNINTKIDTLNGNLIIEIPIIKTLYEDPIELYAVYNSKDLNNQVFGRNIKMNYYKEFIVNNNSYKVKDPYGNTLEFLRISNEYLNPDTLTKLRVYENVLDDESVEITYVLIDKYNNQITYKEGYNYPFEIKYEGMSNIYRYNDNLEYAKSNGEKITLNNLLNASLVSYIKDNEVMYSTNLEYDNLNRLTKLKKPQEEYEFEYGNNYIKIKYSQTNSYLKFYIENDLVIKVESGVIRGNLLAKELEISYLDEYTKLTYKEANTYNSYYIKESYVFYEDDNLSFEIDDKGYGYKLEYDDIDNIIFEGNIINLNSDKSNLIELDNLSYVTTPPYCYIGGRFRLDGETTYNVNLDKKENTLSFLAKGIGVLNIYLDDVKLKDISLKDEYSLYQIPVNVETLGLKTLRINGQAFISSLKLQRAPAGITYRYDNNLNLVEVKSGKDKLEYVYNNDNKLIEILENNLSLKKINYESSSDPSVYMEEEMPYNVKKTYKRSNDKLNQSVDYKYYDEDYNNSYEYERLDTEDNKYIKETQNNFITTTKLNNLGQVIKKHTYSKDLSSRTKEEYKYDSINRLIQYEKVINSKINNSETYNETKNLKKNNYSYHTLNPYLIKSVTDTYVNETEINDDILQDIRYEYDGNELLSKVYVNNLLMESFEYHSNTPLLSTHIFTNKVGYSYTYDNQNRLTQIEVLNVGVNEDNVISYEPTGTGYRFEYNNDLLIKVIKFNTTEEYIIEEYEYEDERLIKIKNNILERSTLLDEDLKSGYLTYEDNVNKVYKSQDNLDYHIKLGVGETPSYINDKDKTLYYASTTYYSSDKTLNEKYEIYPLHKSSISLKGKKPKVSTITSDSFKYDNTKHRKTLHLNEDKLEYEEIYNNGYSAILCIKINDVNVLSDLLTLSFNNHQAKIINDQGSVKFEFLNQTYDTNLEITENNWYKVGIIVDEYEDNNEQKYLKFCIILDNQCYSKSIESNEEIDKINLTLGLNFLTTFLCEMLVIGNNKDYETLISDYQTLTNITTKFETYSAIGTLIRERIFHGDKEILKKKSSYEIENSKTPTIRREKIKVGDHWFDYKFINGVLTNDDYYVYEYDEFSRIKAIKLPNNEDEEAQVVSSYEYDEAGNITKRALSEHTYDNLNRITHVNDSLLNKDYDILYENQNPFLITSYDGNRLKYEVNNLIEFENSKYKVNFEYNHEGLRIKKIVFNKETNLTKTYNYYYEGTNLIRQDWQEDNEIKYINFLYDSNNLLFGFETTDLNRFFYIRNSLKDIVGIIDKEGNLLVKYKWEPYYNNVETTIYENSSFVSNEYINKLNPFRFKGYYYDVETGLFYCKSRYYNPKWGRWITPDSIEYLNPESTNGFNLYAYCGNDPVNRFDPSGHAWEWSSFWQGVGYLVTGIGAIVAGALVIASGVATWPMLLVAGITIGAGALTTINGASEVVEAGTGYNFVEDTVFGGNSSAYNTYATITGSVATVGSIVCGGWYRYNTPRIQAYKNVGNYNFSGTLSDSTHLARPYQHSTLLQRNIIKYGKMVKESSGIYNFTIGGAYKIGWVSYGVGNVGSHPVTWKLVLDIGKQIILHAGF